MDKNSLTSVIHILQESIDSAFLSGLWSLLYQPESGKLPTKKGCDLTMRLNYKAPVLVFRGMESNPSLLFLPGPR